MYQDILFRKPEVLSWLFSRKDVGSVNRQKGNGSMIGHSFKKYIYILQSCRKKRKANFKNQKMFDAESLKRRSFTVRTDSDGKRRKKKTNGEKRK